MKRVVIRDFFQKFGLRNICQASNGKFQRFNIESRDSYAINKDMNNCRLSTPTVRQP